jgi:TonB-dependent SusC/RagA subfamily outer membrane receptor
MRNHLIILLVIISYNLFSQENLVNLSKINFCPLSLADLQKMDPDIKRVAIEQKDFCIDNSTEDGSSEIKFGYKSKLFPGVRFYEPKNDQNIIEKIHLTNEFKGYLPDGKFIEIKTLFVSNIVKMYTSQITFTPNKCQNYFEMIKDEGADFILKIYKRNKPMESGKQIIYEQQVTESIDVLFECYFDSIEEKNKPLYVVDGKQTSEKEFLDLNPDKIKSVTVLKDKNAEAKYGIKGKNGVIEIKTQK